MRVKQLRSYYTTKVRENSLLSEQIDLVQGRVGKNIFVQHYFKQDRVTSRKWLADFKVNHAKKTQKLEIAKSTVFKFTVVPLKAEDCVLTVVFSYTDKIPLFKISQKVTSTTTTKEAGKPDTTETSDSVTQVPVDSSQQIEIKSVDLIISVKQLFRMNAGQVDLVKKAIPIILALGFFAYQVSTSTEGIVKAAIAAAPALITAFGIEGADKWFTAKKDEDADK